MAPHLLNQVYDVMSGLKTCIYGIILYKPEQPKSTFTIYIADYYGALHTSSGISDDTNGADIQESLYYNIIMNSGVFAQTLNTLTAVCVRDTYTHSQRQLIHSCTCIIIVSHMHDVCVCMHACMQVRGCM